MFFNILLSIILTLTGFSYPLSNESKHKIRRRSSNPLTGCRGRASSWHVVMLIWLPVLCEVSWEGLEAPPSGKHRANSATLSRWRGSTRLWLGCFAGEESRRQLQKWPEVSPALVSFWAGPARVWWARGNAEDKNSGEFWNNIQPYCIVCNCSLYAFVKNI